MRRLRFWFIVCCGFTALFGIAGALFLSLWKQPLPLPPPDPRVPRLIDGTLIDPGKERMRVVGVLIDGNVDGQPTVGLAQAPLVWEAPVEGGIPRFLALYSFDAVPEKVGPVRSLRPYFLDYAAEVDALLLHVGGSPEALTRARTLPLERLNQFFDDVYFWRSSDRRAPHNVFTAQHLVTRAFKERSYREEAQFTPFRYKSFKDEFQFLPSQIPPHLSFPKGGEDFPSLEKGDARGISVGNGIRISPTTPPYVIEWKWYPARGYERSMGSAPHVDEDGRAITAQNVLVQFTTVEILDTIGRRRIVTDGEGRALVLTGGTAYEGVWRKQAGNRTRFYDKQTGEEIAFVPGTTWVEVMPEKVEAQVIGSTM